jgi:ketosteroid isomerase-like protein
MTFQEGKVVSGTAFYDSIAFNELREAVSPPGPVQ